MTIQPTTIDGITGYSAIDITLATVENLSLNGTGGDDTLNIDFVGDTSTDLASISLLGGIGNDTFMLHSDTPSDATTQLTGQAGADRFEFSSDAVLTGYIQGNADHDTIDLVDYSTARTVELSWIGATDGYTGTETAITGTFTNIDEVVAPDGGNDTLIGANLADDVDAKPSDNNRYG